jgi:hypothetical protein
MNGNKSDSGRVTRWAAAAGILVTVIVVLLQLSQLVGIKKTAFILVAVIVAAVAVAVVTRLGINAKTGGLGAKWELFGALAAVVAVFVGVFAAIGINYSGSQNGAEPASPRTYARSAAAPPVDKRPIVAVTVVAVPGNGLLRQISDNLYRLPAPSPGENQPIISLFWTALSDSGPVMRGVCDVVVEISRPDGDQQYRSDECSSGQDMRVFRAGDYKISVTITVPGGGPSVSATTSFRLET